MLVAFLKENQLEKRVFRGEVVNKIDMCDGMCRILLKDELGEGVYCLIQGMQWLERIKELQIGQKLLLGPSKVLEVPVKYKPFYAPDIKGQQISNLYFHYNTHDFDLGLSVDCSISKLNHEFFPIQDALDLLKTSSNLKCDILGIVTDFCVKNSSSSENFYLVRLVDNSTGKNNRLTLKLFFRENCKLNKISFGDILVAQRVNFQCKNQNVSATYNKYSGGFALFTQACKVYFCSGIFILTENIMNSVCKLQNWVFSRANFLPFEPNCVYKISNLNSRTPADIVLYLVQVLPNHPVANFSTLVLCDPLCMGYMAIPSKNVNHLHSKSWVRLGSMKSQGCKLDYTENSSFLIVPDWTTLVKPFTTPNAQQVKTILYESGQVLGQNPSIDVLTKYSQEPVMPINELIGLENLKNFARIHTLIIDFHPRDIGLGVVKTSKNTLSYTGLIKVWAENTLLDVFVYGKNSEFLYKITEFDDFAAVVKKVAMVQHKLMQDNWVNLGVKRFFQGEIVVLALAATEIKSYN